VSDPDLEIRAGGGAGSPAGVKSYTISIPYLHLLPGCKMQFHLEIHCMKWTAWSGECTSANHNQITRINSLAALTTLHCIKQPNSRATFSCSNSTHMQIKVMDLLKKGLHFFLYQSNTMFFE